MSSTTLTVQIDTDAGERLEQLAARTGRSPSTLAAEAIDAYLEIDRWQVAGIQQAIASHDRGEGIDHADVKAWVESWGSESERPRPVNR
jgi:RHH-type transcriptional regulator, rel operon repressor / antitoxin RelB